MAWHTISGVYEGEQRWRAVDRYFVNTLVGEDEELRQAREASRAAGLPEHEVSPNQGKLLAMICEMVRARRVLEFGTLAGYSTIWFARAVGDQGQVTTLEVDETSAAVARANFARAGLADRIRLLIGPDVDSVRELVAAGEAEFDVIFIDADKPNNLTYLEGALRLAHPGTVIIADNVVRNGAVIDPDSADPRVRGSRALIEAMGSHPRLTATAFQTVGTKGWDGLALALVR